MCGHFTYLKHVPRKHLAGQTRDKTGALSGARVELYARNGSDPCCSGLAPDRATKTNRWGRFTFKHVPRGTYWIAVRADGQLYPMAVFYEPQKSADTECSELSYQLDESGRPPIQRIVSITLD
jgi:hypothetical protein